MMDAGALTLQMRETVAEADPDRVLATVTYGCPEQISTLHLLGAAALPVLSEARVAHAIWTAGGPFEAGAHGPLRYRHNQHVLLGSIALDEVEFQSRGGIASIQHASQTAYASIFDAIDRTGFPNLVRCWNYFPRINECEDGQERYRQFNVGRKNAFDAARRTSLAKAPAACALGTPAGKLIVHFLASNLEAQAIENPRQVSAYHYPNQYGPLSPTFSRATLLTLPSTEALFVSGTASIVGHASVHVGDVAAQVAETLRNLDAVVEQANLRAQGGKFSTRSLCLRAFLRHATDRGAVEAVVRERLGDRADVTWLQADICRADLLVEIDGFGFYEAEAAPRRRP
jgi:enamine deaminase RidA (YjgF/YER057c/UK114 family)